MTPTPDVTNGLVGEVHLRVDHQVEHRFDTHQLCMLTRSAAITFVIVFAAFATGFVSSTLVDELLQRMLGR